MQWHVSDVSPGTDLRIDFIVRGHVFVLWLTYHHFVAFLNSPLVGGNFRDYTEEIWQWLKNHMVETVTCRRIPGPLTFQHATLNSWKWPGDG